MGIEYKGHEFIQASDIHIGVCRSFTDYLERHKNLLIQIMDHTYNLGLPLLLVGDLLDSKSTTYEERFLLDWWLGGLEKRKIPTIIIAGNHEHLWGEITQLDGLRYMPFKYIKIITWHPDIHIIGDIGIIGIPWRKYKTEELKKIVTEKLPLIEHCPYRVVMLHECIAGSKNDGGRIIPAGTAIPNIPEITYWAIGDIHKCQVSNVANGYYSGAPAQFKFDDDMSKGILKVDLKRPSKEPEFISLSFKPMKTVSNISEITDDAYYRLVGNYEEMIKANNEPMIVKTEYDDSSEQVIAYENKFGICDGLPEFLASKGIEENMQHRAISWISNFLKLKDEVATV